MTSRERGEEGKETSHEDIVDIEMKFALKTIDYRRKG